MSGGATGLGGYIYQQDYLAYRVLASVVARTLMAVLSRHSNRSRSRLFLNLAPVGSRLEQQSRKYPASRM